MITTKDSLPDSHPSEDEVQDERNGGHIYDSILKKK